MATVTRVLPWRRNSAPAAVEVAPVVAAFHERHPKASTELINRAYERAAAAHAGQYRKSGEPYIQHPLAVAIDDDGLFVADTYNNWIKRVDAAAREVTSWIGDDAGLHEPGGLTLDRRRLWVADTNNHRIVIIDRATAEAFELQISVPSP